MSVVVVLNIMLYVVIVSNIENVIKKYISHSNFNHTMNTVDITNAVVYTFLIVITRFESRFKYILNSVFDMHYAYSERINNIDGWVLFFFFFGEFQW